jgi:hypothetical protein
MKGAGGKDPQKSFEFQQEGSSTSGQTQLLQIFEQLSS